MKSKFTLSCDDGCLSDLFVADLAEKYGYKCVFYWPVEWRSLAYDNGYEPLDIDSAIYISTRFEVGSHTLTHRHLTKLEQGDVAREVIDSQAILKRLFKQPISKFCPPRGYTNDEITGLTLEFYDSQRLTKGKGLVHVHPDSGANGNRPWRDCIDEDTTELWFHSWELDKFNLWEEFEEVLRENQ